MAPVAPAVDQAGDAHPVEAGPQPLVRRHHLGRDAVDRRRPGVELDSQLAVDGGLGLGQRRPQRPRPGVEVGPLRLHRRHLVVEGLPLAHRLEDVVLQAALPPLERLHLRLQRLQLPDEADGAAVELGLGLVQLVLHRRQLVLQRPLPAHHLRPAAADLGEGAVEGGTPRLEAGQLGQLGERPPPVTETVDGGIVLLHQQEVVEDARGGRPSPGCRFSARSRAWAMSASMSGMVTSGIVGRRGRRRWRPRSSAGWSPSGSVGLGLRSSIRRLCVDGRLLGVGAVSPGRARNFDPRWPDRSGGGEVDRLGVGQGLAGVRAPDLGRVGAAVDGDAADVAHRDVPVAARPSTPRWPWCGCSRRTRRWCCCRWTPSCRRRPSPTTRAAVPVPRWTTWVSTWFTWRAICWEIARSPLGWLRKMTLPSRSSTRSTKYGAVVLAVGGQGGVGGGHLQGRHVLRPEGDRQVGVEVVGDAHPVGDVDHLVGADELDQAGVGTVHELTVASVRREGAGRAALDVVRLPDAFHAARDRG